jgi:DNA-binding transcriptional MerR regulator
MMSQINGNMTIGQVVESLSKEFKGVSISKLRYLEDEGLLSPKRTKGGYRTYSNNDLETIKAILKLQTEQYLPLHVIREKLRKSDSNASLTDDGFVGGSDGDEPTEELYLTEQELAKVSGVSEDSIKQLITYGLVKGKEAPDGVYYTSDDLIAAKLAKEFERFNVEPRHLRMFEAFVDKKSGLFLQILLPIARQRSVDHKKKNQEILKELKALTAKLEKQLLDRALSDFTSSL